MALTRTVVPKPTGEANGCILRHLAQKPAQKALYVVFFESGRVESGRPLLVV
jgi:hypothetical protein